MDVPSREAARQTAREAEYARIGRPPRTHLALDVRVDRTIDIAAARALAPLARKATPSRADSYMDYTPRDPKTMCERPNRCKDPPEIDGPPLTLPTRHR